MPKRLDDVAPPTAGDEWRLQFGTSEAATDWPQLCTRFPGNCREAYDRMRRHPLERTATQKPLSGTLATRLVSGENDPATWL